MMGEVTYIAILVRKNGVRTIIRAGARVIHSEAVAELDTAVALLRKNYEDAKYKLMNETSQKVGEL